MLDRPNLQEHGFTTWTRKVKRFSERLKCDKRKKSIAGLIKEPQLGRQWIVIDLRLHGKTQQFKKDNWIIMNLKMCWKDKRNRRSLQIVGKKNLELICWTFKTEKRNLKLRWVTHFPNKTQSYSDKWKSQNNFSCRRTRCSRWIVLQSEKDNCQQVGNSLYWLENRSLKKRSKFKLPPC